MMPTPPAALPLLAPLLLPFAAAVASLLAWRSRRLQRALGVLGAAALLAAGLLLLATVQRHGIQVAQMGGWAAPFGITLAADILSAVMVTLTGVIALAVAVFGLGSIDAARERVGYYPLLHTLLLGVCGAFLAGDLFNLYVWFEVMLIASFALLALGGERPQLEGAVKYVTLNLLSSTLFLAAAGITYAAVGTLNFADLSRLLAAGDAPVLARSVAMLLLVAFGIKAAIFPLFFWLPASYHTPPVAVTTLFSGLLTKVGVYALIRVFTLVFPQQGTDLQSLLLVIAALTMVSGVLGAVAQTEIRRLLAFHVISQIGYLIMGLGLGSALALAGAVYFMVHVTLAKSALFLLSGVTHRLRGSFELDRLGGLYRDHPWIAALFLVPAMALAGLPPLSGFWAKLLLVQSGLSMEQYAVTATALAVSLLTLFSMTKIWAAAFWAPAAEPTIAVPPLDRRERILLLGPAAALAALTVLMGVAAEPTVHLAQAAAAQLLSPSAYTTAVLGRVP
jgi:multicomponent Na+:H+ antiporter subunit D